jgi:hypothetical protein
VVFDRLSDTSEAFPDRRADLITVL